VKLEQLLGLQRITLFYLKRNAKVKRIQNHKVKVKRRAGVGAPANTFLYFLSLSQTTIKRVGGVLDFSSLKISGFREASHLSSQRRNWLVAFGF